jgi:hypothetical protein
MTRKRFVKHILKLIGKFFTDVNGVYIHKAHLQGGGTEKIGQWVERGW